MAAKAANRACVRALVAQVCRGGYTTLDLIGCGSWILNSLASVDFLFTQRCPTRRIFSVRHAAFLVCVAVMGINSQFIPLPLRAPVHGA